jgi:GT2 family glycosyltransferase
MDVQWLVGAGMVFRHAIFKEFFFDPWFEETGLCEDLDFSYRVGLKYRLMVVADAKIEHLTGTVKRRRNVWFGRSQITNRYYFVRKNKFSKALYGWASLGQLLENMALGVLSFNGYYFLRAWGNIVGFFELGKV